MFSQPPSVAATRTFQLRLVGEWPALAVMGATYGEAKRALLAAHRKAGKPLQSFKTEWCERYGLPARLFNAVAIDLQGSLDGIREKAKSDLEGLGDKITRAEERLTRDRGLIGVPVVQQDRLRGRIQGGEQRLASLRCRRFRASRQADAAVPRICFGSARLFGAQHRLAEKG